MSLNEANTGKMHLNVCNCFDCAGINSTFDLSYGEANGKGNYVFVLRRMYVLRT